MHRPIVPGVRHTVSRILLLGLFLGVTACGTAGGRGGGSGGGSRGAITRSQIERLADGSAFMVVQMLRPRWLAVRTQATPRNQTAAYAQVFVDQLHFGPLGSLERISTTQIDRIEYLNARDATTQYGTGYLGGIIRVITR